MTPLATATIAFVDLVRFTSLTAVHGDEAGAAAASSLRGVTEAVVSRVAGGVQVVKTLGDGALLRAEGPLAMLEASTAIVHGIHAVRRGLDARGGIHHGPIVVDEEGDVLGNTVNLAARLAELPAPGQFAVTRAVALAAGSIGISAQPTGTHHLRGFPDPIEVFEIDVCEHDGQWITDPVCGMRLDPAHVTIWVRVGAGQVGQAWSPGGESNS